MAQARQQHRLQPDPIDQQHRRIECPCVWARVIGRFDQHYQNFCGFESLHSAQLYLGVFEKLYRFTPFSDDAQPGIRGKSPLQLAGYDLSRIPMTWLCRGYSLAWPLTLEATDVPNL